MTNVSYGTLGLISFLTGGEDEGRAWTIPADLPAQEAAGAVHSDFIRGFIRAEVIPYDDLVRCGGISQGRKEGVLRSEGKTYLVKDGDVINFLIYVYSPRRLAKLSSGPSGARMWKYRSPQLASSGGASGERPALVR